MVKEAQELMKQNKLKEAEAEARKVLEMDPENGAALALKTIAVTRIAQEKYDHEIRIKTTNGSSTSSSTTEWPRQA